MVSEEEEVEFEAEELSVTKIKDAMRGLPPGYRVVFSLYAFEGYDHEEIGEILSISTSTSKSQFSRAKQKLRIILQSPVN